jgi:hypothetical protein
MVASQLMLALVTAKKVATFSHVLPLFHAHRRERQLLTRHLAVAALRESVTRLNGWFAPDTREHTRGPPSSAIITMVSAGGDLSLLWCNDTVPQIVSVQYLLLVCSFGIDCCSSSRLELLLHGGCVNYVLARHHSKCWNRTADY